MTVCSHVDYALYVFTPDPRGTIMCPTRPREADSPLDHDNPGQLAQTRSNLCLLPPRRPVLFRTCIRQR